MVPLLRVGLDFDGVIIDHHDHKIRLAEAYGISLAREQANTNVMKDLLPFEVYRALQDDLYTKLTPSAPPVAGALEAIAAVPAEYFIVSTRSPASIRFAQEWIGRHRLYDHIPAERIFFCGTSEDKRVYCERLRLDVFMDDKLAVLAGLPRDMHRLLFDPDGTGDELKTDPHIVTITDWAEFRKMVGG